MSEQTSSSGWSEAVESIFSYNGNVMLAAMISLLVVILFVLLLHLYAKWFLAQARRRRRRTHLNLNPYRLHNFAFEFSSGDAPATKGLDASAIASVPLFVYRCSEEESGRECVVCLGGYEDGDVGRCLRRCGHQFHVDCLDMWLHSHSNCPICRSPVLVDPGDVIDDVPALSEIVIDNVADRDRERSDREREMDGCDETETETETETQSSCSCGVKRMMSKSERKVHPSAV